MKTIDRHNKILSFFALVRRNIFAMSKNRLVIAVFFIGIFLITALFFLYVRPSETALLIKAASENRAVISYANAELAVDNWFVASITIAAMLFAASALAMLALTDREKSIYSDFRSTPIGRGGINLAYIVGGSITVFAVGILVLSIGFISLAKTHKLFMRSVDIVGAVITLPLSAIIITSFVFLLAKLARKANIYLVVSGIILILLSYFSGLIIPINRFPQWLAYTCNVLPTTQSSLLLEHYMLDYSYYQLSVNIPNAYKVMMIDRYTVNNFLGMAEYKWQHSLYAVYAYCVLLPFLSTIIIAAIDKIKLSMLKHKNQNSDRT